MKYLSKEFIDSVSNLIKNKSKEEFLINYTIIFDDKILTIKELKYFLNRFNSHHMSSYFENHINNDYSDYDWIYDVIRTEKIFRRFKTKGIENFIFNQYRACRLRGLRRLKFKELFDEMTKNN